MLCIPGVRAAASHGQVLREGEEVAIQQLRQGTILLAESPLDEHDTPVRRRRKLAKEE
jgi:hypothetical protein